MGNLLFRSRKSSSSESSTVVRSGVRSIGRGPSRSYPSSFTGNPFDRLPHRNQNRNYPFPASTAANNSEAKKAAGNASSMASSSSVIDKKKKYELIPDNFTSIDQCYKYSCLPSKRPTNRWEIIDEDNLQRMLISSTMVDW